MNKMLRALNDLLADATGSKQQYDTHGRKKPL